MEIELFEPFDKQLEVTAAVDSPDAFHVICIAGCQNGKTIMAKNLAVKWCLDEPGITVMWVAPTDNQALKVKMLSEVIYLLKKFQ